MAEENTASSPALPTHPFLLWYEKNVRLIIPGVILILFSALSLIGFLLASVIYKAMKMTDAYQAAWETVCQDSEVKKQLGEPLKQGWSVSGKIQLHGESGNADFSFPVVGTKTQSIATFKGEKKAGAWDFYFIEYADSTGWKKTPVNRVPEKKTEAKP